MSDKDSNQIMATLLEMNTKLSCNGTLLIELKEQVNRYGQWATKNDERLDAVEKFQSEQRGQLTIIKAFLTVIGLLFTGWIAFFKKG